MEKCDRGYIWAGFRALRRGGRGVRGRAREVEVKGKLHAGGGSRGGSPAARLHFVTSSGGDAERLRSSSECRQRRREVGNVSGAHGWFGFKLGLRLHQHQQQQRRHRRPDFSSPANPSHIRVSPPPPAHGVLAAAAPPLIFTLRACPSLRLMSQHCLRSKPFQKDSWEASAASAASALRNGSHHRLSA